MLSHVRTPRLELVAQRGARRVGSVATSRDRVMSDNVIRINFVDHDHKQPSVMKAVMACLDLMAY